jgi:hypothetical protein
VTHHELAQALTGTGGIMVALAVIALVTGLNLDDVDFSDIALGLAAVLVLGAASVFTAAVWIGAS